MKKLNETLNNSVDTKEAQKGKGPTQALARTPTDRETTTHWQDLAWMAWMSAVT